MSKIYRRIRSMVREMSIVVTGKVSVLEACRAITAVAPVGPTVPAVDGGEAADSYPVQTAKLAAGTAGVEFAPIAAVGRKQELNALTAPKVAHSMTPAMLAAVLTGWTVTRRTLYRFHRLRYGGFLRRQKGEETCRNGKSCIASHDLLRNRDSQPLIEPADRRRRQGDRYCQRPSSRK